MYRRKNIKFFWIWKTIVRNTIAQASCQSNRTLYYLPRQHCNQTIGRQALMLFPIGWCLLATRSPPWLFCYTAMHSMHKWFKNFIILLLSESHWQHIRPIIIWLSRNAINASAIKAIDSLLLDEPCWHDSRPFSYFNCPHCNQCICCQSRWLFYCWTNPLGKTLAPSTTLLDRNGMNVSEFNTSQLLHYCTYWQHNRLLLPFCYPANQSMQQGSNDFLLLIFVELHI